MGASAARDAGRSYGGFALRVVRADQFAAERYRQELCIRYLSGLRNKNSSCFCDFRAPRNQTNLLFIAGHAKFGT